MLHALSIGLGCLALWLLLSGYFDVPLLLGLGLVSCALVMLIAWRVETADPEEEPLRFNLRPEIFLYWPWLLWQIILANIEVAKIILDPKLPISPTMIGIKPSQRTDMGRVTYANSITLTPGTVTTSLSGGTIDVHALTQETADHLLEGEMDRRVARLEGPE